MFPYVWMLHTQVCLVSDGNTGAWCGTSCFLCVRRGLRWGVRLPTVWTWWNEDVHKPSTRCCWSDCTLLRTIWQREPPTETSACLQRRSCVRVCISVSRCFSHSFSDCSTFVRDRFKMSILPEQFLVAVRQTHFSTPLKVACQLKPTTYRQRYLIWATRLKSLRGIYWRGTK